MLDPFEHCSVDCQYGPVAIVRLEQASQSVTSEESQSLMSQKVPAACKPARKRQHGLRLLILLDVGPQSPSSDNPRMAAALSAPVWRLSIAWRGQAEPEPRDPALFCRPTAVGAPTVGGARAGARRIDYFAKLRLTASLAPCVHAACCSLRSTTWNALLATVVPSHQVLPSASLAPWGRVWRLGSAAPRNAPKVSRSRTLDGDAP